MSTIELLVSFQRSLPKDKLEQIASAMARQANSYGEESLVTTIINADAEEDLFHVQEKREKEV